MKYSQIKRLIKKYPCKELNGRYVAYDAEGRPLGCVVYREGVVIERKLLKRGGRCKARF